jgi:hypothetical protein
MNSPDGYWRCAAVLSVVLIALNLAGCSQHPGLPTSEEAAGADQHLPFDAASDKGGIFPTGSLTPTAIPAGTPLAIRLRTPLSSATSRTGDLFEAVLDESIVVRGRTVAPRGASITGKILDARASDSQEPGYMRLALTAVSLNGQSLPIQTSSIFVKRASRHEQNLTAEAVAGGLPVAASTDKVSTSKVLIGHQPTIDRPGHSKTALVGASTRATIQPGTDQSADDRDVGLSSERRLTFRLAQPVPLGS